MSRDERPDKPLRTPELLESMTDNGEPVVCELTAGGRGAICVLGVSANQVASELQPFFAAMNGKPLDRQPHSRPVYGRWNDEDIIVCLYDNRYAEVHCHGGEFARQRIINDLATTGFQVKRWTDLSARSPTESANAFSVTTAMQAILELPKTTTRKTAAVLTWQTEGALDRELAAIDALIDAGEQQTARRRIRKLIDLSRVGLHMTRPWRIAIAGTPNVGKSSLINRIVGFSRSIVFDMPGTTRDLVTVETAIHGWPVTLIDTAGLRESEDGIERAGIALAEEAIRDSDLVVEVIDGTSNAINDELDGRDTFGNARPEAPEKKRILVINKCDIAQIPDGVAGIRLSALTGEGLDLLLQEVATSIVPDEPPPHSAVPFLQSQVDALTEKLQEISTS